MAWGEIASQSGVHSYGTADKAVDGNNNTAVNLGSCAHPDTSMLGYQPAWWRVDLGEDYDVYKVKIVNRDQFKGTSSTFLVSKSDYYLM